MNADELDRLRELTSIGAGHAADAFSRLVDRPIWMRVSRVCDAVEAAPPDSGDEWSTGVFFEFEGAVDAVVGILFRAPASEVLVRRVVGEETGPLQPLAIESALMEVGNILASHVASAIADTLGVRLLPSIPTLAMENAEATLASLVSAREGTHPLRIECELTDDHNQLGGLVALVPRASGAVGAARSERNASEAQ